MRRSSSSMVGFFCADSFFRGAFAGVAALDAASGFAAFWGAAAFWDGAPVLWVAVPSGAAARAAEAADSTITIAANQKYPPALRRAFAMLIVVRPSQSRREFSGRARLSGGRTGR